MAMSKKISPNRRKSIAGIHQGRTSLVPKNRRRAHSIVPGALSPLAKARRSLAPRKSILKASVNVLNIDASSQQSGEPSQTTSHDDATFSMDLTRDFTAPVHDNTTRKSFGRRVSFASHSHVRLIDKHTNNTDSPQSSPSSVASPEVATRPINNENVYPGQSARSRRSSVRYSMAGSEDMDLTTIIPAGNPQTRGSAILDEELDYDDEDMSFDDTNMDVTQAIHGDFSKKRSLSMGRQPLSRVDSEPEPASEVDESRSDIGNESMQSEGASGLSEGQSEEQSQAMEFTVPLGHSLRRPAEQDEVWMALKQMTHSGNEPSEPALNSDDDEVSHRNEDHGMNLDDAMERLRRARDSLPLSQVAEETSQAQDDTFTSTEDSFEDVNDGNKTLNLSHVLGRPSIGLNSRMSLGYSNMDESEVYGNPAQSTPRQSLLPPTEAVEPPAEEAPPRLPLKSSVFQPPPPSTTFQTPAPASQPLKPPPSGAFTFTPRAPSPSKSKPTSDTPSKVVKPKPSFSAAFAPPVARPSPRKAAPAPSVQPSPAKRARPTHDGDVQNAGIDKPTPAKKQTLASKWMNAVEEQRTSPEPTIAKPATNKPKPLSPSKKALFQAPADDSAATEAAKPSALRRPSGYFAKRKSLAVGFNPPSSSQESAPAGPGPSTSPKKKALVGKGRVSLGSAPSDAWTRFDKNAGSGVPEKPPPRMTEKESEASHCVKEATRQASVAPSPTRGSPSPVRILAEPRPPSPERHIQPRVNFDISTIAETPEDAELSGNMDVDVEATQQWRQGVQQEYVEEEELPEISIAQFFTMTGIKFMDELTAPRRSIHPSQQPIRQPRNPSEIPLAEYVTAMAIDVPQLDLYSRVSKDLEAWMSKSKVVFAQAEEEAAKVTPELFVEYARADEEGQAELMHQLNLIRTHTRYLARSEWYDWKLQWVEGLRITADEAFTSLESDARILEDLKKSADTLLPDLEKEYEQLMRELEHEQAEIKEIEESDQDYLNELKATVTEQNIEIEALQAELKEGTENLRWLQERSDEIESQKREAQNTITTAERILQLKQTSTRAEVFKLKAELEALEDLHMFRITKVNPNLFEYVYSSLFQVSIPCKNFVPVVPKVKIMRSAKQNMRYKDDFPKLSTFLLSASQFLVNEGDDVTVRQIVHRLNDFWSSCAQLRSQLALLNIKYPVEIIVPSRSPENSAPSFKARAAVMFPGPKGKAFISFAFSFATFSRWPMVLESLDADVQVAYGSIDRSEIMKTVVSRLSQATPSENYACLLDACIEAQDLYQQDV